MAIKRSKSAEMYFTKYKTGKVYEVNRRKKLEKLLLENPNNKQIELALKDIHYRRKTPKTHPWTHQKRAQVILNKVFEKAGKLLITLPEPKYKSMNALGNRAHDKQGNLIGV